MNIRLPGEREQQLQGFGVDPLLGEVEQDLAIFDRQPASTGRVTGKQTREGQGRDAASVRDERLPSAGLGEFAHCCFWYKR